jgi:hypothetical protein
MSPSQLDEAKLEELKRKLEIDEKVAAKYGLSKWQVEKDLDPRLVKLLLEFLNRRR